MVETGGPRLPRTALTRRRLLWRAGIGVGMVAASTTFLAACRRSRTSPSGQPQGGQPGRYQPGGIWYAADDYTLPDETAQAVPGGVLPSFIGQDIAASLDLYVDLDAGNLATTQGAYEYLLRQNRGPGIRLGTPESQQLLPHLAASYEVSPDALTYIFKLRRGVKFQNIPPVNGREMDIEDWRASHERFMAEGYYRNTLRQVLDRVEFPINDNYADISVLYSHCRSHTPACGGDRWVLARSYRPCCSVLNLWCHTTNDYYHTWIDHRS